MRLYELVWGLHRFRRFSEHSDHARLRSLVFWYIPRTFPRSLHTGSTRFWFDFHLFLHYTSFQPFSLLFWVHILLICFPIRRHSVRTSSRTITDYFRTYFGFYLILLFTSSQLLFISLLFYILLFLLLIRYIPSHVMTSWTLWPFPYLVLLSFSSST